MFRKLFFTGCFVVLLISTAFAWTNCPPAALSSNPAPIISSGASPCIAEASWAELGLNNSWSREVALEAGQSYWFAASKCARAYAIAGEVRDEQGKVLKSNSGSSVGFCFRAPKTGKYKVSYSVTGLNGSYSYAITNACLSRSTCSP